MKEGIFPGEECHMNVCLRSAVILKMLETTNAADVPQHAAGRVWMAGNGREMNNNGPDDVEQQEKFEIPDSDESREIQKTSSGLGWLRQLADWALKQFGRKIIQGLSNKASSGDATAARLLVNFAEKKVNTETWRRPAGKSLAQMLAEEPEWVGPPEDAETDENGDDPSA